MKTKDFSNPANNILTLACVFTEHFFFIQKALPFPMTPKQYDVSEQSISITENNLAGTVPSIIAPPPLLVETRQTGVAATPGKEA
jgi:hypothetical protein